MEPAIYMHTCQTLSNNTQKWGGQTEDVPTGSFNTHYAYKLDTTTIVVLKSLNYFNTE